MKSCLRSGKWAGKAQGGPCVSWACWVVGEETSLGGVMLGLPEAMQASPSCHQGGLSCSPRSSWKTTTQMPGLPSGPGWVSCHCHSLTAGTRHLSPPKLLSCVLIYKHVKNSEHQEHQWQHQGEADVDLYVEKSNLCWCRYNKNHSAMSYIKSFTSQNPTRCRKARTWCQQRVHHSDVVLHGVRHQPRSAILLSAAVENRAGIQWGICYRFLLPLWLFLLIYPLSMGYGCTDAILLMKGAMQLLSVATESNS